MSKDIKYRIGTSMREAHDREVLKSRGKKNPFIITAPKEYRRGESNRAHADLSAPVDARFDIRHVVFLNNLIGKRGTN